MDTENLVKLSIENNVPMLITGETGSGKSSIVKSVARELKFDLYDLRCAGITPEDIGGYPRVTGNYYEYLMPKWFADRLNSAFVLFLDEINQASIQVLHALYGVVLDRMVAGVRNPNMRVIAACNDFTENEYVTDIMKPLRERFAIDIKHTADMNKVFDMMKRKYPSMVNVIEEIKHSKYRKITPRNLDFGLNLLFNGCYEFNVIEKQFGDITPAVLRMVSISVNNNNENFEQDKIRKAAQLLKTGSRMFGGICIPVNEEDVLKDLSEEGKITAKLLAGKEI